MNTLPQTTTGEAFADTRSAPSQFWRTLDQHTNNFNAIRLILAALVIVAHSFPLSYGDNTRELLIVATRGQESFGEIAVDLFFVISGVFITASWFRSQSMQDFLYKRILRIYPGFVAALLFSAALTWIASPEFRHTVHLKFWLPDLLRDLLTLDYSSLSQPGIFAHNPLPNNSNGSLWTIQKEFCCYILVAVVGMFSLLKRRGLILGFTVLSWTYYAAIIRFSHSAEHQHFPARFITYFLIGMSAWLFRNRLRFSWPLALAFVVILIVSTKVPSLFSILFPIAGSYLALWLGLTAPWKRMQWTDETDLSYGVYLYAFPVQQVVASSPSFRTPLISACMTLPLTFALAWLSRRFVEEPFLAFKSKKLHDFDPGAPRKDHPKGTAHAVAGQVPSSMCPNESLANSTDRR